MDEQIALAERFEAERPHLRAVAYRMLGSLNEADDALQEAWLRLSRSEVSGVENLRAWLTTVTARVCLNLLRARRTRREEPLESYVPEPIIGRDGDMDPEHQALLADAVGLAVAVVLETLAPSERIAFVLHDMFAVPFEEIAPLVGRTPTAARQLASRARRRVQKAAVPDPDLGRQRHVIDAFIAASRRGDLAAVLDVLDPEAVMRIDRGEVPASRVVRGATAVANTAILFAPAGGDARPALVNGAAGRVVIGRSGEPVAVIGFVVAQGRIVEIDILSDPLRVRGLDLSLLDE